MALQFSPALNRHSNLFRSQDKTNCCHRIDNLRPNSNSHGFIPRGGRYWKKYHIPGSKIAVKVADRASVAPIVNQYLILQDGSEYHVIATNSQPTQSQQTTHRVVMAQNSISMAAFLLLYMFRSCKTSSPKVKRKTPEWKK